MADRHPEINTTGALDDREEVVWGAPPGHVPPPLPPLDPDFAERQRREAAALADPDFCRALRRALRDCIRRGHRDGTVLRFDRRARHTVPHRSHRRAPRRANSRTASRRATTDSGGDDDGGDGDPPPHIELARAGVTPIVVTDAPAAAGVLLATLGLTPRQLRELVDEHEIPHARRHASARHIYVRVDDVLSAWGLGEPAEAASSAESDRWDEDEIVARAAKSRGGAR